MRTNDTSKFSFNHSLDQILTIKRLLLVEYVNIYSTERRLNILNIKSQLKALMFCMILTQIN
jgi:hypothetical protein